MSEIDKLRLYKQSILDMATSAAERRFLEDSFTRWYMAAIKGTVLPEGPVVNGGDLAYANRNKRCRFAVTRIVAADVALFHRLFDVAPAQSEYPNRDHLVSAAQLSRLRDLYVGDQFEQDKNKLINIYEFIGMNTIHLSVPDLADAVELFGSPLNTRHAYCSPFAFESSFGSLGSFFEFELAVDDHAMYIMNPPYDEVIIAAAAERLNAQLEQSTMAKTVLITIPVWDSATQRKVGIKDYGLEFAGYTALAASKFFKEHRVLDKHGYPYWDYYKQAFVPATFTHLILLSTGNRATTLDEVCRKWKAAVLDAKK